MVGTLLQPFIPTKAREILDALGVGDGGEHRGWDAATLRERNVNAQIVAEAARYKAGWTGLFPKLAEVVSADGGVARRR